VNAERAIAGQPWLCVKCTAAMGAHYLTCTALLLPAGYTHSTDAADQAVRNG